MGLALSTHKSFLEILATTIEQRVAATAAHDDDDLGNGPRIHAARSNPRGGGSRGWRRQRTAATVTARDNADGGDGRGWGRRGRRRRSLLGTARTAAVAAGYDDNVEDGGGCDRGRCGRWQ
uniref:Uncharacterized protein n=1 Tax=Oryza sativa subsp. japonica TaxID=39947 RepID=Q6K5Z0_ORYSJ|nr:hypothetical protein [Oryza sativa Japonica Group]